MILYLDKEQQDRENNIVGLLNRALFDKNEEGSVLALDYLNKRKVNLELIDKFKIGWYPKNRNIPGKSEQLKGRIILPILDEYGDARALSGRLPMNRSEMKSSIPYFHESYPKSFFLYGMNIAWKHLLNKNQVVLVEGQFDVLTCHRCGIKNCVGIMGSHLKYEAFVKINRFCERYILMFDEDDAGKLCSEKAKKMLQKYKKDFIEIRLKTKDGDFDPDEFASKYGDKSINKLIKFYEEKKQKKDEFKFDF